MAVPKRRTSPSKRKMRRAANSKLIAPNLVPCPNPECGEAMVPHRACPKCGTYKGRTVIEKDEETKEE